MGDAESEYWWWSDPAGTLKTVEGAELRDGLKSGRIPARSLVWKTGWADWYHASTVPELADAVPVLARRPRVEPGIDPDKLEPPPPPLDKFASYDKPARIGSRRSSIPPPRVPTVAPPRPAASPALPKLAARASAMPHATSSLPGLRPGAVPSRPATTPPPPPVGGAASTPRTTPPPPPVRGAASSPRTTPPPPPVRGAGSSPRTAPPPPPHRSRSASPPGAKPATEPALPEIEIESVFDEQEAPTRERPAEFGAHEAVTTPFAPPQEIVEPPPANNAPPPVVVAPPADIPPPPDVPSPPADIASPPADIAPPPADIASPAVVVSPPPMDIGPPPDAGAPTGAIVMASAPDAEVAVQDAAPPAPLPSPLPPPTPPPPAASPEPPFVLPGAPAGRRRAGLPFEDRLPPPGPQRTRLLVVGGVLGASVLVLLIAGISRLFSGKDDASATGSAPTHASATATASVAAAPPATPPPAAAKTAAPSSNAACSIVHPATRLARSVAPNVPLYLSDVPGSSHLAIGLASGARNALGLTVDPETLAVKTAFHHSGKNAVLGVVPLTTGGKLAFAADRDGSPLDFAHTIDGTPPFIVGLVDGGFAQAIGYGEPAVVWPMSDKERITEPRVATAEGSGHAVAFRHGGRSGEIRVGWLTADGKKKSELGVVKADGPRVGTPSIAAGGGEILVTFAARPQDDAPWAVRVAHAKDGAVPAQSRVFAVPPGGPGGDAISPAAAAPDAGRWILQWTEGGAGNHVVRVQLLDAALDGAGAALTVSPPGQDAGQGAIWAGNHHAVALFLIKDGSDYALWGTALACP